MEPGRIGKSLWRNFFDIPTECPYGLAYTAVYRQALFGPIPDHLMDVFLASGFRRNGNTLYTMVCRGCRSCVPIRFEPGVLRPNRSQRRVWKRNQDLEVNREALQITPERLALCDKFLRQRYPGKQNCAIDYSRGFFMNTIANTFEITYRDQGRLLGTAVVDMAEKSLNAVYFYFDPDEGRRSLGTFNILQLAALAKELQKEYLYLGYWIREVAAMSYKANFRPHFLLQGSCWERVDR